MSIPRPCPQRGNLSSEIRQYGSLELGASLSWFPAPQADSRNDLIIVGTHGDENSSTVTLSCALRTLRPELRRHHVVLTVNPDDCQLGLRVDARGVDPNRNFPAANWKQGETVYHWNSVAEERDVVLLTGEQPGSEWETQALCRLIHQIHPAQVVSFHDPLVCIEDPGHSPLGYRLVDAFSLPLVGSVGYDMSGSLGSWRADIGLPYIIAEFPSVSANEATERYLPAMTDLPRWQTQR